MEIIKNFNPLTGTYEYYNIITHEWVGVSQSGLGLFDSLASIASKVVSKATSDATKELAKTTAKSALESASKKAGDELGKYAVEKIVTRQGAKDKKTPSVGTQKSAGVVDPDLIVKELQKMDSKVTPLPVIPKRLYRGGRIKRIFKK